MTPFQRRMLGGVLSLSILFILVHLAKSGGQVPPPVATNVIVVTAEPTLPPTALPSPLPPTATPMSSPIFIRASNYWPPAGGHNCAYFVDGLCLSRMSSGEPWQRWIERAAGCPAEWPFGTIVIADDRPWVCLDRGGRVRYEAGVPWVDFLTDKPFANYGQIIEATLVLSPAAETILPTAEPICMSASCLFNPSP